MDNSLIARTSEQFKNEASNLLSSLDALLGMLREGRWDEIGDIESQLLPALKAVGSPVKLTQATISRRELEQLIQKLERAIEECNIRKAQIAPLINALSVNQQKQS
ncbi:hypothetical protein [Azonexus sp.]|uniref:hypothetical protein n=1 Tax=Azonexus sp. TaxID=1872668 RepID=UPI0027B89AD4|nr:hypothetical protein [Azonexus sp.]